MRIFGWNITRDIDVVVAKLSATNVKQGDILILNVEAEITDKVAQALRERFEEQVKTLGVKAIVLGRGLSISVLSKPAP